MKDYHFFAFFKILIFLCRCHTDLVHGVEAIFALCLLTKLKFHGHYSYFRKDFQMLLAVIIGLA